MQAVNLRLRVDGLPVKVQRAIKLFWHTDILEARNPHFSTSTTCCKE